MTKYKRLGDASVAIEYLNNHVPQKVVKEVLRSRGVTEEALELIDWNKSKFPGPRFKAIFPKALSQWPSVPNSKSTEFPKVHEAVKLLFEDQGMLVADMRGFEIAIDQSEAKKDLASFELPKHFDDNKKIDWARVDKFLSTLSQEDLETFCQGDQDDIVEIADKGGPNGAYAHRAVEILFETLGT